MANQGGPFPVNQSPTALDRIKRHRGFLWLAALSALAITLGTLTELPSKFSSVYYKVFPNRVDESELKELDTGKTGALFRRVLGDIDSRQRVRFPAPIPSAPNGTEVQSWEVWSWRDADGRYAVTALVDQVDTVQALGIQSFSRELRPVIPIMLRDDGLTARLRESTFSELVPRPNDTGSTLGLIQRSIGVYANTTMPKYSEVYHIGNPEHRTVALSIGGEAMAAPGDDSQGESIADVFEVESAQGSISCDDTEGDESERCGALPDELAAARTHWRPNGFWILADGIDVREAESILLIGA